MLQSINDLNIFEFEKFGNFVNSPFFNSRPKIIALFNYLKEKYPNINRLDTTKENIFKSIYEPSAEYSDGKIRRLISDFISLYDKFLGYIEMQKIDKDYERTVLLEALQNRGLNKKFEQNYKEISSSLKKKFIKDDAYYRNMSRTEWFNSNFRFNNNDDNGYAISLQNASDNTDLYFVFQKLHIFRDMVIGQMFRNSQFNFKKTFFTEIIKYINNNLQLIKKSHPNLYIIYLTLMATIEKEDNYITDLVSYLKLNEENFEKERLNYYYNYVTTFFWIRINDGYLKYRENVFDMYKYMIQKDFFKTERYIPHIWLNNVVNVAIAAHEFSWLKIFLEKNKNDIEPEFSKDAYNLSLARLFSEQGEYKTALKYLQDVQYKDPNYYINSKNTLSKILYEMEDLIQVEYILDSLKHYAIRNKKLVKQQISNINMLVKYMGWLLRIKSERPDDLINMKISLDNQKLFVPNKDWFYVKIEELEKIR